MKERREEGRNELDGMRTRIVEWVGLEYRLGHSMAEWRFIGLHFAYSLKNPIRFITAHSETLLSFLYYTRPPYPATIQLLFSESSKTESWRRTQSRTQWGKNSLFPKRLFPISSKCFLSQRSFLHQDAPTDSARPLSGCASPLRPAKKKSKNLIIATRTGGNQPARPTWQCSTTSILRECSS